MIYLDCLRLMSSARVENVCECTGLRLFCSRRNTFQFKIAQTVSKKQIGALHFLGAMNRLNLN